MTLGVARLIGFTDAEARAGQGPCEDDDHVLLAVGVPGPERNEAPVDQWLLEFNRGQWAIENRDHYVRDVTLGEDRCRVRTAARPSILATMRSYAIGALRLLGFTKMAEATPWARTDI